MSAEWLTHSPATLDVTGSRPNSVTFEIYYLELIVSGTEGLKMVCETSDVSSDNWKKLLRYGDGTLC